MSEITPAHFSLAYALAREVYHERLTTTDALAQLTDAGMNRASASFSIGNLRQMLNGAAYHRAMSIPQTRHYLTSIHRDYGTAGLKRAVAAFSAHLPYLRKSSGSAVPGLTKLRDEFAAIVYQGPTAFDAVDDLVDKPEGNSVPDRANYSGTRFKRDHNVRAHVVKRSSGRCEHCGQKGFLMANGEGYVETHHIIGLAKQGPDTLANVIALCPNHHREAHFGKDAAALERAFLSTLAKLSKCKCPVGVPVGGAEFPR